MDEPPTLLTLPRLIVVEDSPDDFDLLTRRLRAAGWPVAAERVESAEQLRKSIAQQGCLAVISDHQLPNFSSLEALAVARGIDPDLPFLVVSGTIGAEVAVAAMRAGADDYIMKDDLARLVPALQRALAAAVARKRQRDAEAQLVESEARFRALAGNLPGVVFELQHRGGQLSLVYVNDGAKRLFGMDPQRLLDSPQQLLGLIAPGVTTEMIMALEASGDRRAHLDWIHRVEPGSGVAAEWIEIAARARTLPSGITHWTCVASDVTPQKRAEQQIRASRQELRELATHLTRIREQERESIAREIHDDVGSTLNAVKLDLAWLRIELRDAPSLAPTLRQMDQLIDSAIHSSTRIMHDLRPGILDEGIVASLEWQARAFRQRMGIPCTFVATSEDIELDREQAIALFRICQESLNNIVKYAHATAVEIRLVASDARLDLEIQDDGRGIAPADIHKANCFGLRGMRERTLSLGGDLRISDRPDGGTIIGAWLPTGNGRRFDSAVGGDS